MSCPMPTVAPPQTSELEGLPPGPPLPAMLQGPLFARDPVGVLRRCRARYGPVFTLRFSTVGPVAVVADSSAVPELVVSDPSYSHAGEARRSILPQASPHSSCGADETQHERARARLEPAMDAGRLESLRPEIKAIAGRHVQRWPDRVPVRVLSRMRNLTQEIFVRLVLGVGEARAKRLTEAMGHALATPGNPPLLPIDRNEGMAGRLLHQVVRRRIAPVVDLLSEEIEERRRTGPTGETIVDRLASEDRSLDTHAAVDELIVVLAAAQEPPAIALTWIIERLARSPDLTRRFLDSGDGEAREAIFDETLRLNPPAVASLRKLKTDTLAGRHRLPSAASVMVPIALVHRDPAVFSDPETFHPERFSGSTRPPTFIPFGAGTRRCPGEALARMQMRAIVPLVMRERRIRFLGSPERPVQRATVMVPHRSGLAISTRAAP